MRVIATSEARIGSTRLPGKVLKPLNGMPMLGQIVRRVPRFELIDDVVVASTNLPQDDLTAVSAPDVRRMRDSGRARKLAKLL